MPLLTGIAGLGLAAALLSAPLPVKAITPSNAKAATVQMQTNAENPGKADKPTNGPARVILFGIGAMVIIGICELAVKSKQNRDAASFYK